MPKNSYFNVIPFNDYFINEIFFKASIEMTNKNIEEAKIKIGNLQANGNTLFFNPLNWVYS